MFRGRNRSEVDRSPSRSYRATSANKTFSNENIVGGSVGHRFEAFNGSTVNTPVAPCAISLTPSAR